MKDARSRYQPTLFSERRSNDPHQFRIDPDAELMRKGRGMEARLRYIMENRHHLVVHVGDSIRHSGGGVPEQGRL